MTFTLEVMRGTIIIKRLNFVDLDVAMDQWLKLCANAEEGDFLRFFHHGSLMVTETKRTMPEYEPYQHRLPREYV